VSGLDNTSFTVRTFAGTLDALTNTDYVVIYTASAARIVNLPDVSTIPKGRRYTIINGGGASAITINPAFGSTIDGGGTLNMAATSTARADIVSDGSNWFTTYTHG